MYTKNLASVLQVLNLSRQNGVLQINPLQGSDTVWYAFLILNNGIATGCQIVSDTGTLLRDGPEALLWLTSQNELSWSLALPGSSPSRESSSILSQQNYRGNTHATEDTAFARILPTQTGTATGKLRRTALGKQLGSNAIQSRTQRHIFNLIDGRKTPEEIAELLHKTPTEVRQVLNDLYIRGFIE